MRTAIEGIGVLGGFGCWLDKLHRILISGESTPQTIQVETIGGKMD